MAPITTETNVTSMKEKCLDNVQKILECPVCYKIPGNPDNIHFCSNGHLLCESCQKQILDRRCPTCRSENWNGHHTLMPLIKQILEALPKLCPFPGCQTLIENIDVHMNKCHLVDCIMGCSSKLPFNGLLKHLEDVHHAILHYFQQEGHFRKYPPLLETDFNLRYFHWSPSITKFDGQTFTLKCYKEEDNFYCQMFFLGNITDAENYLCQIRVINKDDPRFNISFSGEVISVEVPVANKSRKEHFGTFSFSKTMARKLWCNLGDEKGLYFEITIVKKNH